MKLYYYAFLFAEKLVAVMPVRLVKALGHLGALAYYLLFRGKRRLVYRNMRRVLGEDASRQALRRTVKSAYRYYSDYWVDILWLPTRSREYVLERFDRIDEQPLEEAIGAGKGVLVVLPHYGSWEAGAVYLSSLGPFAAVAEVLRPPELFELFCKLRKGVGIDIFPYDHKPETREKMIEALKNGTTLALLCDRDLKGSGVDIEFFGEKTTFPPGPAALALRSGSPIVCVNVRNLDDGTWIGHATEPIFVDPRQDREEAIATTMQEVAHRLEELIREDPAQWHMFMPAWPSDREG